MRRLFTRPLLLLILLVTSDPDAGSSESLAADRADLGKDTAHYNANRTADFLHMRVEMRFTPETILARSCQGRVVHTLRARGEPIETVRLDAVDMNIRSVEILGEDVPLEFGYDDR